MTLLEKRLRIAKEMLERVSKKDDNTPIGTYEKGLISYWKREVERIESEIKIEESKRVERIRKRENSK